MSGARLCKFAARWFAGIVLSVVASVPVFALPPHSNSDADTFGVCTHILDGPMASKAAELGVGWVRLDFNWFEFQPRPGEKGFEWAHLDRWVDEARKHHLKIFATVAYAPEWAGGGPQHNLPPRLDPDSRGDTLWKKALRTVVERYQNDVVYWGIWNEPNLGQFWAGDKQRFYSEILKPAADVIRTLRRTSGKDARIVGPEFSHHFYDDPQKWRISEIVPYVDVVSVHVYADVKFGGVVFPTRGDMYGFLRARVKPELGGKPLWITETGKPANRSREDQAAYYENTVLKELESQRDYVAKIFPYHLWTHNGDEFSLVNPNWEPFPAFTLYQKYIRENSR